MAIIDSYPILKKAEIILACSNDMIRRDRSAEEFLKSTDKVLSRDAYQFHLPQIEAFAAGLTPEDLETVADGEHGEIEAICARNPMGGLLNELLNDIFEEG